MNFFFTIETRVGVPISSIYFDNFVANQKIIQILDFVNFELSNIANARLIEQRSNSLFQF